MSMDADGSAGVGELRRFYAGPQCHRGAWAPRPPPASYPSAPGRLVVTAVGADAGLTLWGKTEWMKWGKA
jgi:hypothetical protein